MKNFIQTYPGHTIWELNIITQEIGAYWNYQKLPGNIVSVEKNQTSWYCSALNKDAAFRKFNARAKRAYKKLNPDQ
jgi:hypothetical protein